MNSTRNVSKKYRAAQLVAGSAVGLGILFASASGAFASTAATVPTGWFTGSIVWDGSSTGSALISMATVTPAAAQAAAVASVPGTAGTPQVIHDHGYVVYRLIVTAADGTQKEVIVDAGDAGVLDSYTPQWDGTVSTPAATNATPAATPVAAAAGVVPASVPTGWFTGSIPSNGATGSALVAMATTTPAQAQAAATAVVAGTAGTPQVIHMHGYVVYRLIVTAADGTQTEVIVDGGTAAVLDHYTPQWDGNVTVVQPAGVVAPAVVSTGWFTGSILSNGATGLNLIALATTTPAQAQAAATAAVPGTAGVAQVVHMHGYVVYRTIVTQVNGTQVEVIVDGGNATVLDHYAPQWDGVIGD